MAEVLLRLVIVLGFGVLHICARWWNSGAMVPFLPSLFETHQHMQILVLKIKNRAVSALVGCWYMGLNNYI